MRVLIALLTGVLTAMSARADIRTESLEYEHGGTTLRGYLAWDDALDGRRPGVLVVHEWWGLNEYAKGRARQLAGLGYLALAVDMYGHGKVAADMQEAGALATALRNDRALMRARAAAALDALKKQPLCDPTRTAAIGYCFGGGVVLELARSGAELAGVVSFHGNLDTPLPAERGKVKAKVLVLHGAADPHVPMPQVLAFRDEMDKAGADWQLIMYGGAVHAFTNPAAGNDPKIGAAYDAVADARSWKAMQSFFDEVLAREGQ